MFSRIGVLKNFEMFTGKHMCWSLKACNFIKKKLQHTCFSVKFAKFLRTPSLQNTSGGCFWKYIINSLFIAYENDEWCHFVGLIGSPALILFYCRVFHFFPFLPFLFFSGFYYVIACVFLKYLEDCAFQVFIIVQYSVFYLC